MYGSKSVTGTSEGLLLDMVKMKVGLLNTRRLVVTVDRCVGGFGDVCARLTASYGGSNHCHVGATASVSGMLFDWFDDVTAGRS